MLKAQKIPMEKLLKNLVKLWQLDTLTTVVSFNQLSLSADFKTISNLYSRVIPGLINRVLICKKTFIHSFNSGLIMKQVIIKDLYL